MCPLTACCQAGDDCRVQPQALAGWSNGHGISWQWPGSEQATVIGECVACSACNMKRLNLGKWLAETLILSDHILQEGGSGGLLTLLLRQFSLERHDGIQVVADDAVEVRAHVSKCLLMLLLQCLLRHHCIGLLVPSDPDAATDNPSDTLSSCALGCLKCKGSLRNYDRTAQTQEPCVSQMCKRAIEAHSASHRPPVRADRTCTCA